MKKKLTLAALAAALMALVVVPALAVGQRDPGTQIAQELAQRNRGYGDMRAEVEMVLRTADGRDSRRAIRLTSLERPAADEGDLSMIVFDSPRDVAGTALLSHAGVGEDDQQWLYLPAARRTRRISSGNMTGPFVGSEFSYEDITGGEVDKYTWRLLGEAPCGQATCRRLETRPRYEGSGYARRVVSIDAEYRIQQIEFFDRRDQRMKTLTYSDYRRHGRFWRAHRWTMVNHQNGKSTTLVFRSLELGTGLNERDFTRAALERAR